MTRAAIAAGLVVQRRAIRERSGEPSRERPCATTAANRLCKQPCARASGGFNTAPIGDIDRTTRAPRAARRPKRQAHARGLVRNPNPDVERGIAAAAANRARSQRRGVVAIGHKIAIARDPHISRRISASARRAKRSRQRRAVAKGPGDMEIRTPTAAANALADNRARTIRCRIDIGKKVERHIATAPAGPAVAPHIKAQPAAARALRGHIETSVTAAAANGLCKHARRIAAARVDIKRSADRPQSRIHRPGLPAAAAVRPKDKTPANPGIGPGPNDIRAIAATAANGL